MLERFFERHRDLIIDDDRTRATEPLTRWKFGETLKIRHPRIFQDASDDRDRRSFLIEKMECYATVREMLGYCRVKNLESEFTGLAQHNEMYMEMLASFPVAFADKTLRDAYALMNIGVVYEATGKEMEKATQENLDEEYLRKKEAALREVRTIECMLASFGAGEDAD